MMSKIDWREGLEAFLSDVSKRLEGLREEVAEVLAAPRVDAVVLAHVLEKHEVHVPSVIMAELSVAAVQLATETHCKVVLLEELGKACHEWGRDEVLEASRTLREIYRVKRLPSPPNKHAAALDDESEAAQSLA